ncbi:hypothetical protein ABB37_05600 [Leptomonas pyrrhocoris]|uniref:Uncharacterized protein n=1 Tax=Leptomonas pyrrhocoris TaxID=157538 RepID=A0A0N0VES0_LEPPY|nr:hypothetical protein ABB37_05600 [Leptomonas pyrrhocoris]XP_015657510.1 hypothetical protein ABB37_05600 [Leptomonas pyrrhocoris]KPA79070.1 hypothetical protein ABB37_05600 [Leptomonas pyrrhocoris]KPA79071.1 hypothetical protein ABB37_05600 [Leptomonas pyrrhocoris]|eukprot:XP_015657509.1 hypothetical protein ABB37_05600 [Leptomonas pyrrhocoris]
MDGAKVTGSEAAGNNTVTGQLYKTPAYYSHITVTPLSHETDLDGAIHSHKGRGYVAYFAETVKEAQAKLVAGLREGGVEVAHGDDAHLLGVCGVNCRDRDSCIHTLSGGDIRALCIDHKNDILGATGEHWTRVLVCLHNGGTTLHDLSLECFPRGHTELVVRVHLYYPNNVPCGSVHDRRARLVTKKQFVPKDARSSQGHHLLHHARIGARCGPPPCESLFPSSTKGAPDQGFTTESNCTAITVETVFVRDASRRQQPFYAEDTEQARVYFSYLHASELVTDEQLSDNFPSGPLDAITMPAFTEDRDKEKFNVLVRLYLLAHDQGWTSTLTDRSPHPLNDSRLPVLFRYVTTQLDVADRRNPQSLVLVKQELLPDVESQVVRFCFGRVVSDALRRRIIARSTRDPSHHARVVCYLPYGTNVPAFTDAQIAVLAALYPALGIRKPTCAADWCELSRSLHQHGVPLLDILQSVGTPLTDRHGADIVTDVYVPYTPDMAGTYFVVIANRPLRDYISLVNQRWLLEDLLGRTCDSATTHTAFSAWVRYWGAIARLKHELEEQMNTDTVSAHLGLRLPAGARGQPASCLVNGRVTDGSGGLVFAELCGRRFADAKHVGHLPPGTAVVYRFRWDGDRLHLKYLPTPSEQVAALPLHIPHAEKARRPGGMRGVCEAPPAVQSAEDPSAAATSPFEDAAAESNVEAALKPKGIPAAVPPFSLLATRRVGVGNLGYGLILRHLPAPPPAASATTGGGGSVDGDDDEPQYPATPQPPSRGDGRGSAWGDGGPLGGRDRGRGDPRASTERSARGRHVDNGDNAHEGVHSAKAPPFRDGTRRGRNGASPTRGGASFDHGDRQSSARGRAGGWHAAGVANGDKDDWERGGAWRPSNTGADAAGGGAGGGRDDCFYDPNYVPNVSRQAVGNRGRRAW